MNEDLRFSRDSAHGEALFAWHKSLEHDTGGRAELRRAAQPSDAVFVPAFHRLRRALEASAPGVELGRFDRLDRLAAIACTVARVREDARLAGGERTIAAQFARVAERSDRPRVSAARFRRLLEAEDVSDLMRQLRRLVALLDGSVDLVALADTIYRWGHGRTRQDLAYEYYGAVSAREGAPERIQTAKGA